ncbi:MAG: type III-A CRISPR-associated protein Cas10/Csm1 [Bacteroidetes bacterium SW_10_40_5]|nr:MAG: type III-A CRISPR-associated protein Cas10/Csm1 [Bacteroidetes bacterium SW_10_40_5]
MSDQLKQDTTRQKVYLAALLHDIGKFYQRADDRPASKSDMLSNDIQQNEALFCPESKRFGKRTHKHALYTAQFFEDINNTVDRLFQSTGSKQSKFDQQDSILQLAACHHNPHSFLQRIIQKADHYTSGMDRSEEDPEAYKDIQQENDPTEFKKMRMCSIFEGIGHENVDEWHYRLPLKDMTLSEDIFPSTGNEFTDDPDYQTLWQNFQKEANKLDADDFSAYADSLFYLLHRYTLTIPSSTQVLPDVSLFDHLKITGAMALSLYDYYKEKGSDFQSWTNPQDSEEPFLLVGCDLSGIQSYIYDIISKRAAKNLKGRSFYLQLLLDSILRNVLQIGGLYEANTIYSSGGGFYVLGPNTEDFKDGLAHFSKNLEYEFFNQHKTRLFAALDYTTISVGQIMNKNIGECWQNVIQKLNERKRQRYSHKITSEPTTFFEPQGRGAEAERDAITGDEIIGQKMEMEDPDDTSTASVPYISLLTKSQINLGKHLKQSDYWVTTKDAVPYWKDFTYFHPFQNAPYHYLVKLAASVDHVLIRSFNEPAETETLSGKDNIDGFTFYGGNQFPSDNGEPKTFDQLAGRKKDSETEQDESLARLGVLRMDVDSLGQLFIDGFHESRRTFSRYSTLSRNLDYFFKGYINTIWETYFRDDTFIIYSGGDDLFIVGKWDQMIVMAKQIYRDFRKWTCWNENLTLSGGLWVCHSPGIRNCQLLKTTKTGWLI